MYATMTRNLELGVIYSGLGWFCYQVIPVWYQHDTLYSAFMLVYILLAGVLQECYIIDHNHHQQFRIPNPGLPYCLLLPLSLHVVTGNDGRFATVLIPLTLLLSISHCKSSMCSYLLVSVLFMAVVGHIILFNSSEIGLTLMLCVAYTVMMEICPAYFNKSFSFGELSIVCEMYIHFMYCILRSFCIKWEMSVLEKVTAIIFFITSIIIALMCILKKLKATTIQILTSLIMSGMIISICVLYWFLPSSDIEYVVGELFESNLSIVLLLWWICCTILSLSIVCYYGNRKNKFDISNTVNGTDLDSIYNTKKTGSKSTDMYEEYKEHDRHASNGKQKKSKNNSDQLQFECSSSNTSMNSTSKGRGVPMFVRKYFHVMILGVFIPGMILNHRLLYVASCTAAAVFLIIEAIRVIDIDPISSYIDKYLRVFLDKQDQGDLILTPIYLLIGCSLPLWIIKLKSGQPCSLVHYCGLLSVGIGDAAASVVGKKLGYHTWPGSKKTIEGTTGAFISQLLSVMILKYANVPDSNLDLSTILILILVSCLEAFTQHIDNLVVPVYAIMLFLSIDNLSLSLSHI